MEKSAAANYKPKNKIFRLLSFQNHAYSPSRDNRADINSYRPKAHLSKGFSGPIISMIPAEARSKSRNFETQEPTSPKVSCMGQIKHKHKIIKQKHAFLPPKELIKHAYHSQSQKVGKTRPEGAAVPELKKKPSGIKKIFGAGRNNYSDASANNLKPPLANRAPSISQMRRFASSRDTFANFDWTTAHITAPEENRDSYSDEDREYSDGEDDVIIPFSAPILVAGARAGSVGCGLEPRKEINLWKRRTMTQPKPLQLNMVRAQ